MTVLSDLKAALVADVTSICADLTNETVTVLDYEPRTIASGRVTVTVVPAKTGLDYYTFTVRVYCPIGDPASGEDRLEAAVALIAGDNPKLGAAWLDPDWAFGWDERTDQFIGQAAISTPRGI